MDNDRLGDTGELKAAAELRRLGGTVSIPFGKAKYDLVVDIGDNLYKVQVKTGSIRDGEEGSLRAVFKHSDGYGYDEYVDAYIVYNPYDDECYWLWTDETAVTGTNICLLPRDEVHPPNRERATFAADVNLSERIDELSQN